LNNGKGVINIKKYLSQIILIAVLTAGVSFFAGMKYQQSRGLRNFAQLGNGRGGQMVFDRQEKQGLRPVAGEIIKADGNSITVKMADGSSKIVILSDSTEIGETTTVGKDKLTIGSNVVVFGTENNDGSVTAENVQLNPDFKGRQN
jgi:uncharacterized protein with beta-barrel porin domain